MEYGVWILGLAFVILGLLGTWYNAEQNKYGTAGVFLCLVVIGAAMLVFSWLAWASSV
jgi:uncharacterized membrane protein